MINSVLKIFNNDRIVFVIGLHTRHSGTVVAVTIGVSLILDLAGTSRPPSDHGQCNY